MSKIFSKNIVIGLLLISNCAFAVALFGKPNSNSRSKKSVSKLPPVTKATVGGASFKNDNEVQACYEALLHRSPIVSEGTVVMNWILDEQGNLETLKLVQSDLEDELFKNCLLDVVQNTRFPASVERAGVLISHRFKFRQKNPESIEF